VQLSVIVSTYNRPDDLWKVLWGYAVQRRRDFELVVADDGSGPATARLIERFRAEAGVPVLHVWHEDRGFRKTQILNRAALASSGSHLLFTDGDCIPRADLVEVHHRLAEEGRYLAGGYIKLPEGVSRQITLEDVLAGRFADLRWLRSRGWRPGRRALRLTRSAALAAACDLLTPTSADFQGNNASVSREAFVAANGFEGEMGYGSEDRALGYRLRNLGIRGKQIRHRAICIHLHHDRPYVDAEEVARNRATLARIRRSGETRARFGLAEVVDRDGPLQPAAGPQRETRT
jgi:glycosyltransferase involved in cell wall biosynthesis